MENGKDEKQMSFPFQVVEQEIMNPISGQQMSDVESYIATLLLDGTSEEPIPQRVIIDRVADALGTKLTPRKVKLIIRSLRRNRRFPILTRRSRPSGYYWCRSEKELKEWAAMWAKQAMDELTTLSMITKANFPRLAGQKFLLVHTQIE